MARESKTRLKARTGEIISALAKAYPDARCSLDHVDPFQLLVATILSAQCTDKRVNIVTPVLFKRHRTARDFAKVTQEVLEREIHSTGFFRNKAKSIRGAARMIVEEFAGEVPRTMDQLLTLPGVARKTANVVLGSAFGRNEGIVVDTHVSRVAQRLGLTKATTAEKIEQDLMPLVPVEQWCHFGHLLVFLGRYCCTARKADCAACPVSELCPSAFSFEARRKAVQRVAKAPTRAKKASRTPKRQ